MTRARAKVIKCFWPPGKVVRPKFVGYRAVPRVGAGSSQDFFVAARL
jgi:hypothetical protein